MNQLRSDRGWQDEAVANGAYALAAYSSVKSAAQVEARQLTRRCGLSQWDCQDFVQEGLLELWRRLPEYDAGRACLRTFASHVVTNHLASLMRRRRATRRGCGREAPLDEVARAVPAVDDRVELRLDVSTVLGGMSPLDRAIASSLADHSVMETSRRLGVSRTAAYRAIGRLRVAFVSAGFRPDYSRYRLGARVTYGLPYPHRRGDLEICQDESS
jgi:RNA polymerase sigma factor (sigma-70 family)